MPTSITRRRKSKPYDPSRPVIHDRKATDLIRNIHTAPDLVPDPYQDPDKPPNQMIAVIRQFRDDPLGRLRIRKQITEPQYQAGRAFQADWEIAERGPQATDPSKEYVDGGLPAEPITERGRKAIQRLIRAKKELGTQGSKIACSFLIHGSGYKHLVSLYCLLQGERSETAMGHRIREILTTLESVYNLSTVRL
jgi:hypothetical protein